MHNSNDTAGADGLFVGIDVGSLTTKSIIMDRSKIISSVLIKTGADPQEAGKAALEKALEQADQDHIPIRHIVGTGYGRIALPFVDQTVTELTCHAKGVRYLNPEIKALIDIGGQDSKAIRLNPDGSISDFAMNDRCAAGTGRFLEVMADALETDIEEFGRLASGTGKACNINSTCIVFAESEVISLLASGRSKEDIAAGLHQSIAKRVGNMAKRIGIKEDVAFVGGVGKNVGVKKAMESFLGTRFLPVHEDPQLTGALGAAVLALESHDGYPIF